jgi:uncharacterized protein YyaL (SSP411 family)
LAASKKEITGLPVFEKRCDAANTWYYVCSMGACQLPVKTLEEALRQIN